MSLPVTEPREPAAGGNGAESGGAVPVYPEILLPSAVVGSGC